MGGDRFIQSLARGVAVIRAFRPGHEKLTMAQVASAAGLPRAGARRVLLTLKELGYVEVEGRNFFLTSRVLDLSQGYVRQTIWDRVRPVLQTVTDTLNETASACVLEGFDVVYTLRIRPERPLHWALDVGAHLPAHASSMGRVLLSALLPEDLERYLHQVRFQAFTPATCTDLDDLRTRLKDARQQSWCLARDEIAEGLACVSVPLRDRKGRTIAALGISMSSSHLSDQVLKTQIVPLLQRSSLAITKSM
jgi:IclR family pca regulon transcriptional regulator